MAETISHEEDFALEAVSWLQVNIDIPADSRTGGRVC